MRGLVIAAVLGLGIAGTMFLMSAIGNFGYLEERARLYALIAGLVAWGLATILLIIGMFAFRSRG
jgi:hypothetical protein